MAKKKKKRKQHRTQPAKSFPIQQSDYGGPSHNRNIMISNREFMRSVETIVPGQDMLVRTVNQILARPGGAETYERQAQLVQEYNQTLVGKGLALSRGALKRMDLIDMTAVIDTPTQNTSEVPHAVIFDNPDYVQYLSGISGADMFYHAIPCFTKGVVQINRDRYIQFEIRRIDIPGKTMDIWLHDYGVYGNIWSPGVSGTLRAQFFEDQRVQLSTLEDGLLLFTGLYHVLDFKKDLHWSKSDVQIWENIVVAYSRSAEAGFEQAGTNNVQELGRILLRYVALLNYFLMLNKPKAVRKPRKRPVEPSKDKDVSQPGQTQNDDSGQAESPAEPIPKQPERLVRKVGMITITSAKIPRESTERSVAKYKVAVWKARGGVRRMKDGRLIPFKESVRHRKALMNADGTIPQSVIQLTDNRIIKERKDDDNAAQPH